MRWRATPSDLPCLGTTYSPLKQASSENQVDRQLAILDARLREVRSSVPAEAIMEQIIPALAKIAALSIDLHDHSVERLLGEGFGNVSLQLARWARRLDPAVSLSDILQASRNVWTACGLQLLLGVPMVLTPGLFAYSMLYPYSDNLLDDPELDLPGKIRFNDRFGRRLMGEQVAADTRREGIIFELISLIESQYPRSGYPGVFRSLLDIHAAQTVSLQQTSHELDDLESVTVTKGGTSVLADAWLVKGVLTTAEAQVAFDWGVLLQLGDDLQDVREDQALKATTLFTWTAGLLPLDELTNRLFHFGIAARQEVLHLPHCTSLLANLLSRSVDALLIRSVGLNADMYSRPYLSKLERYSPLSFTFVRDRREWMRRRSTAGPQLFDLFVAGTKDALARQ